MQILIFEWLTGGGRWIDGVSLQCGSAIQSQGMRMLQAIAHDFLIGGIEVILPIDERAVDDFPSIDGLTLYPVTQQVDLRGSLEDLANNVDRILLIAPETGGRLLDCIQWLRPFHDKLVSPREELVRIASSKQASFEYLRNQGFDGVSRGTEFVEFWNGSMDNFNFPVVVKPNDGVGGEGLHLIHEYAALERLKSQLTGLGYWIEPFYQGVPVSISVICHGGDFTFLPATEQVFDGEPFGEFVGSRFPVQKDFECRARRLAEKTVRLLPPTQGYIGLDMVLGPEGDQLIEINPRLTMSYLKLRKVCSFNLAMRMLGPDG